MKYFVLGALASGFMLYGISMLYGATGTLDLSRVAAAVAAGTANHTVLVFGLVFLVAGLAFKLGTAPFHMWVPDVYQGSPTSVTLLLGAAPKLAAFAIVIRLLVEGLGALVVDWQQMLVVMSVVSLAIGNITAIAQTNIKRMLAYSTISQMGFMLLGLLSGVYAGSDAAAQANAYSSAMFYSITYVLTTLGTFAMVMLLSRSGFEAESIDDFKGLSQRSPWFAVVMMVLLLSLAGVPPMVGFYAKLSVLQAVLASGQLWLAFVAVFFSLIGAFYYLRVVKAMYFHEPADHAKIHVPADMQLTLSANGIAVVLLGLMPSLLLQPLVENAIKYAVSPMEYGAEITVEAQLVGPMLRVTVSDTGPGLSPGTDPSSVFGVSSDSTGIGLANIRDRLVQAYGENQRFDISNRPEGGFQVVLELPFEAKPEPVPAMPVRRTAGVGA